MAVVITNTIIACILGALNLVLWWKNSKLKRQTAQIAVLSEERLEAIAEQIRSVQALLEAERSRADDWKRRTESLSDRIEGILGERDWWNQAYHQQASEHAAAQALLLREITRLVAAIQRSGKKAEVSADLTKIVSEFAERHPRKAPIKATPETS